MWHVVSGLTLACITLEKLAALVVVEAGRRCDVRVLQAATTFLFLL
jgi:putative Ca2+/H+ antiporter (TMEM165/GDT1 family)